MDQGPVHPPTHDDAGRSFLPPGFDSMEQYLSTLQEFLHRCEPITNLMIVDYFTTNSWETRMPQDWRDAFESPQGKLSSLDLMELVSLGKLREYKSSVAAQGAKHDASGPQDWPESLKDFVRMIKTLSINRTLDPDCKWMDMVSNCSGMVRSFARLTSLFRDHKKKKFSQN